VTGAADQRFRHRSADAVGRAVGEGLGMDRLLKSNTSKRRTHSLLRQGCMLYELIPTMPKHRLLPLMEKFAEAVANAGVFAPAIAVAK
jgi:hypothetical protein